MARTPVESCASRIRPVRRKQSSRSTRRRERLCSVRRSLPAEEPYCLPYLKRRSRRAPIPGGTMRVRPSVDSGQRSVLVRGGTAGRCCPRPAICCMSVKGRFFAMPFDEQQLAATGTPVPILSGLAPEPSGRCRRNQPRKHEWSNRSRDVGGLRGRACWPTLRVRNSDPDRSLVWVDRQGREIADRRRTATVFISPRISPDGRHLALDIRDQERDIWIWNFDGRTLTKLTFDPETDVGPVWSPDGKRIAYFTNGKGLRWQAEDGTGSVETLTTTGADIHQPANFTSDGKSIIIVDSTGSNPTVDRDVKILHIGDGKLEPLLADPKFSETTRSCGRTDDGSRISPTSRTAMKSMCVRFPR